jgi:hypothetical protein
MPGTAPRPNGTFRDFTFTHSDFTATTSPSGDVIHTARIVTAVGVGHPPGGPLPPAVCRDEWFLLKPNDQIQFHPNGDIDIVIA